MFHEFAQSLLFLAAASNAFFFSFFSPSFYCFIAGGIVAKRLINSIERRVLLIPKMEELVCVCVCPVCSVDWTFFFAVHILVSSLATPE